MCVDIVEIWFGIAIISSIVTELSARNTSVFSFPDNNLININIFSPNLVCALVLCRSSLKMIIGNFCHFWQSYLPATYPYFRFRIITSKFHWIFIKFGICIYIVKIWCRIANGQISSFFDIAICPRHNNGGVLLFHILAHLSTKCSKWTIVVSQCPLYVVPRASCGVLRASCCVNDCFKSLLFLHPWTRWLETW